MESDRPTVGCVWVTALVASLPGWLLIVAAITG